MSRTADYIASHQRHSLLALVTVLTLWTFVQRYPVDDAFISYRYAQNLVAGEGLVWNPGERVEGYSNFLWTLLIAAGMKLGIEPERFVIILSFPPFVAMLLITHRLALQFTRSVGLSLLAVFLTGLTRSVWTFATSGMETPLQVVEFLGIAWLLLKCSSPPLQGGKKGGWTIRRTAGLSTLIGISIVTRPDAVVPALVALFSFRRAKAYRDRRLLLAAILPVALILIPYVIWKLSYYGALLPNSFNVKVRGLDGVTYGLLYLHLFLFSHFLYPFAALLGSQVGKWESGKVGKWESGEFEGIAPSSSSPGHSALRHSGTQALSHFPTFPLSHLRGASETGSIVLYWLIYTVAVGGDFMEFRFLAPIVPLLIILILTALREVAQRPIKMALTATLIAGVVHGNFAIEQLVYGYGVESIRHLRGHLTGEEEDWVMIGKRLGSLFKGTDLVISVGAAGAIPYYSGLKTVDFLGLTDKEISHQNEPFSKVPGHRVIAHLDQLVRKGVSIIVEPNNFMFSRPEYAAWAAGASWRDVYRYYLDPDGPVGGKQLDRATLVAIPIDDDHILVAWYLQPHPAVEQAIQQNGWRTFTLNRW